MEVDKQQIPSVFEKVFHDVFLMKKIAQDVPLKQHWNLAAIDRKLHSIICELDAKKHRVRLTPAQLDDASTFASITNSKRTFDEIDLENVENKHLDQLKKIAEKYGQNIKKLCCSWITDDDDEDDQNRFEVFESSKLEAFFKKLPNLVNLKINIFTLDACIFEYMIGTCNVVIKNLKMFTFNDFSSGFDADSDQSFINFSSLIASDTIEEFQYGEFNAGCRDFIKRQSKIKTLDNPAIIDANVLSHLKLENILSVPFDDAADAFLRQLFRDHGKTLKKLIVKHFMDQMTIGVLCERLANLQHLSININNENAESLIALERLKELKILVLDCSNGFDRFDLLLDLSRLKLSSLKEFKLITKSSHDFDEVARNIGDNWENLEKFAIHELHQLSNRTTPMNGILEQARKLKALSFNFHRFELKYNGQIYPLMQEFSSVNICDMSFITSLNIFPNLRKLDIRCAYRGPLQLKCLAALKKLKELNIRLAVESSLLTPSDEEISLFKQLCHQIEKFWIYIESPLECDFCRVLAPALSNYANRDETRGDNVLSLRSQKY